MKVSRLRMALTGMASGAVLSAPLVVLFVLGARAGLAEVPFTGYELFSRVLPDRLVTPVVDLALRVLRGLGFDLAEPVRTAEQFVAVVSFFVVGLVVGLLFFTLAKGRERRHVFLSGLIVGAVGGLFTVVITFVQGTGAGAGANVLSAFWILALFLLWGVGLARLHRAVYLPRRAKPQDVAAPSGDGEGGRSDTTEVEVPEKAVPTGEARVLSRRRFVVEVGGLVATIVVAGAGLGEVLRSRTIPASSAAKAPIRFPNAGSSVKPVPGTRPEYTAVADHYRTDINLEPPSLDGDTWRLPIDGQVSNPFTLTLDQIRSDYESQDLFITLSCVSNPLGGSLIGTTLWTGVPFRDILVQAKPLESARYVHLVAADEFDEVVELAAVEADPRVMLVYAWNGEPLPAKHGYPLRLYVPDLYGMKQPKWITGVSLVPDFIDGFWVTRGWDRTARMKAVSVIDTVATDSMDIRGGQTYVPIGGIAHAGDRGISTVEIQVDGGEWQKAQLRQPLSELTWVIWRYDWPFAEGEHRFAVRATDGQGKPQETEVQSARPAGATGIHDKTVVIQP